MSLNDVILCGFMNLTQTHPQGLPSFCTKCQRSRTSFRSVIEGEHKLYTELGTVYERQLRSVGFIRV